MSFVDGEDGLCACIQDLYRFVPVPGGDVASIRGPGQRLYDASCIFGALEKHFSRFYVPDLHRIVPITRGNVLTVGRPGDIVHKFCISWGGEELLPRLSIPRSPRYVPPSSSTYLS